MTQNLDFCRQVRRRSTEEVSIWMQDLLAPKEAVVNTCIASLLSRVGRDVTLTRIRPGFETRFPVNIFRTVQSDYRLCVCVTRVKRVAHYQFPRL